MTSTTSDSKTESSDLSSSNLPYELVDLSFLCNYLSFPCKLLDIRSREEYSVSRVFKSIQISLTKTQIKDNGGIDKLKKLQSSHPNKLDLVYGKKCIIYSNNDFNSDLNIKIFKIITSILKQMDKSIDVYVLNNSFSQFENKYPFLIDKRKFIFPNDNKNELEKEEKDDKKNEDKNVTQSIINESVLFTKGYPSIILKDKLYLGNAQQAINHNVITNFNITHIANITRLVPNTFSKENLETIDVSHKLLPKHIIDKYTNNPIKYCKIKLIDSPTEDISSHLERCVKFIDDALKDSSNRVLVHCQMGISRSTTIVLAYLMSSLNMTLCKSYLHTRYNRPVICPNDGFLRQLVKFEMKLFNGKNTLSELQNTGIRPNFTLKEPKRKTKNQKRPKDRSMAKFFKVFSNKKKD